MGDKKRIGTLFYFLTNRARNRMAIRMQIRTRVDSPLDIVSHLVFTKRSLESMFKLLLGAA
jgi:hypothetical protein